MRHRLRVSWSFCLLSLLAIAGLDAAARPAEVVKNARVRAGPDINAQTIAVLPVGDRVEVLDIGADGWARIAFPEHATVWVHGRNLAKTPDERVLRVTGEGAHIRADSRIQAPVLGRLREGETVIWNGMQDNGLFLGRRVGDWYAVRVASLPVFVHSSLLQIGSGGGPDTVAALGDGDQSAVRVEQDATAAGTAASPAPSSTDPAALDALWRESQDRYQRFRTLLADDPAAGLQQDWLGLELDLGRIIDEDRRIRVRLLAHQMRGRIRRLVKQAELLHSLGLEIREGDVVVPAASPLASDSDAGAAKAADGSAGADPVATGPERAVELPTPAGAEPEAAVERPPVATDPVTEPEVVPVQPPKETAADVRLEGWLMEEQVPDLAVHHMLKSRSGELLALIKVPPESGVQLADYNWQHVRISGLRQTVDTTVGGIDQQVTLLILVDIERVR